MKIVADKMDGVLEEWEPKSAQEAIRMLVKLRDNYEALRILTKQIGKWKDRFTYTTIPEIMRTEGIKTITLDDDRIRCTVNLRWSASMIDKDRGLEWLKENGHGDLIQDTVNAQTLASFARNLEEDEGIDLPDDIFKVGQNPVTSITKI